MANNGVSSRAVVTTAYYAILIGVLALILVQGLVDSWPDLLPKHVSRNSEGVLFALVLSAWIQFGRGKTVRGQGDVTVSVVVGLFFLLLSFYLLNGGLASSLKTLNEATFALAVLVPYVTLRRPLGAWWWAIPLLAIAIPVAGANSDRAVALAETFAFLLVIPIAVDFADPAILNPSRRRNVGLILGWIAVVIAVPVLMHIVRPADPQNLVEEVERYLSRTTEAYVAVIVIQLYFSFLLPWAVGRRRTSVLDTAH